jgi:hypothetical protein
MRMCAELAELGMDLARAAAARARADWAKPEEPPAPEAHPEPPPEPEVAAPGRLAQAARPPRVAAPSARAASCKPTDPALIFTRLVTSVRDCITLEARLAAGLIPTSRGTSPALRADPRRASLQNIFRRITGHHPDRAELIRQTTARIDEDLAADPDRTLELPELFFKICEDFGIEVDLATLPDEFLGVIDDLDAPDPRATYPP